MVGCWHCWDLQLLVAGSPVGPLSCNIVHLSLAPSGSQNLVPALAGIKARTSALPGGSEFLRCGEGNYKHAILHCFTLRTVYLCAFQRNSS